MLSPSSSLEFTFNSGRASPCGSSPSTPKVFGDYYFSAPTTPARAISIYGEVDDFFLARNSYVSTSYLSSGFSNSPKIEPESPHYVEKLSLKHTPYNEGASNYRVQTIKSPLLSTKTERRKSFWNAFSPKRKKDQLINDHYEIRGNNRQTRIKKEEQERGRLSSLPKTSKTQRRAARSLSPVRKSKYPWEEEEEQNSETKNNNNNNNTKQLSLKGSKKWRLKDLFLFRSASDGRAYDKDPLKKYSYFHRKQHEAAKSKAIEGSENSTIGVRKGPISAHELHYTVNKAISQDMKKKSFLPYKQGILGRLAFNPAVHGLANGFGSLAYL